MGLSAGQTSHNSLQKSTLNINGKISTKLLCLAILDRHHSPTSPGPPEVTSEDRGCDQPTCCRRLRVPVTQKILNQPDLHMTMVPQPPPQHSPQVGVFLIRSAIQAAVSSSQTTDVVVSIKAQRRDCQRWSHADRPQFTVGVL